MKNKKNIFKHLLEPIFGNWKLLKSQIVAQQNYMIDSNKTNDFSGYFKIHYYINWDHNWKQSRVLLLSQGQWSMSTPLCG